MDDNKKKVVFFPYVLSAIINHLLSIISWIAVIAYIFVRGRLATYHVLTADIVIQLSIMVLVAFLFVVCANFIMAKLMERFKPNKIIYWAVNLTLVLLPYIEFILEFHGMSLVFHT